MAIETVSKAGDEHLTHTVVDFLMGETDGVPKVIYEGEMESYKSARVLAVGCQNIIFLNRTLTDCTHVVIVVCLTVHWLSGKKLVNNCLTASLSLLLHTIDKWMAAL